MAVKVALVGVGGYGAAHIDVLRPQMDSGAVRLVAGVDPHMERARDRDDLVARGVALHSDFDAWCGGGCSGAELVILASPIHFHCRQSCAALAAGVNVLCEKPVAATLAEAGRMAAARDTADRLLAVGYQWAFSTAVQKLKHDIGAGLYGEALRLRTWVAWPRNSAYYGRNSWAGRALAAGRPVYDSPVSNATAHYLFNMLYLLGGSAPDSALAVDEAEAELYRANQIENYDAACMRLRTAGGPEILFYSAHCVEKGGSPTFVFEFERGVIAFDGGDIIATLADGKQINYGSPNSDAAQRKLEVTLEAVRKGSKETLCGVETAAAHTAVVEALQQITVKTFDPAAVRVTEVDGGHKLTYMPGLYEAITAAFDKGLLFSEYGASWAATPTRLRVAHGLQ